ncbi:MAG: Lar family restriction alleviation protein [Acidaminococcaceae bacterium]
MEKLKPCPFCGGKGVAFRDDYNNCGVYCSSCNAMVGVELESGVDLVDGWRATFDNEQKAVEAWNHRAKEKEPAARER